MSNGMFGLGLYHDCVEIKTISCGLQIKSLKFHKKNIFTTLFFTGLTNLLKSSMINNNYIK